MAVAKSEVRDLIVQLTGSPEDEARLAVALSIADDLGTHGIGVHLHQLPDILDITDPVQSVEIRNILEASDREADRMVEWLSAAPRAMRCATQRCRCSWRTNERCVVFNGHRATELSHGTIDGTRVTRSLSRRSPCPSSGARVQ